MSKKCDECKRCAMNDDMTNVIMSSADWQRNEQRHLRREKRFVAIIILVIVLFAGSNTFGIWKNNQYKDIETITEETYEVDASDGGNAVYNEDESVNING